MQHHLGERSKVFPLKSGMRQGSSFPTRNFSQSSQTKYGLERLHYSSDGKGSWHLGAKEYIPHITVSVASYSPASGKGFAGVAALFQQGMVSP